MSDNFDFDFDFGDTNNSSNDSSFDFNFNDSNNDSNDNNFSFDESSNDFDFGDNTNSSNNYEFESSQFDNNDTFNTDKQPDDSKAKLKKTAIIIMAVGIGLLIITFLIGSLVNKKDNKQQLDTSVITVVDNNAYNNVQNNNVNNIISSGNPESTGSITANNNYNKKSDWTEIDANQQVLFNNDYTSLTFTITGIKHLAHITNNNLHIKTVLSGSLSGLSGTYEVEVPYNKGVMLSIGNEFTVNVLLGNYNQKTVVGDIKY